jgi:hypothetical protein
MDYIYEWDGFYYEYTSFQVMPYEVSIDKHLVLWEIYQDRKKVLERLIEDINFYDNNKSNLLDDLKNQTINSIYNNMNRLDLLNKKIKEIKRDYNLLCDDMPKVISLDDSNLVKRIPKYKWICKNCEKNYLKQDQYKFYNEEAKTNGDYENIFVCPNCGSNELIFIHPNIYNLEKYHNIAKTEFNKGNLEKGIENGLKCISEFEQVEDCYDEEKIGALQYDISSIYRWVACGYNDLDKTSEAYKIADEGIRKLHILKKYNRTVIYEDLHFLHRIRLACANKSNSKHRSNIIIEDYKKIIECVNKMEEQYIIFIKNGWATQEHLDEFRQNKDSYKLFAYYFGAEKIAEISDDLETAKLIAQNGLKLAYRANINSENNYVNLFEDLLEDIENILSIRNEQKNSSKGGCYVATAVYGSYDCPQVWTLRRFRDNYLIHRYWGRLFVKLYYRISPTLVKNFGEFKWFNFIFRSVLDPFVKKLNYIGYNDNQYTDADN